MTAELERLATLRNQGVLTDDEFAAAKARLLGL
jgi:Short C-terminal domain